MNILKQRKVIILRNRNDEIVKDLINMVKRDFALQNELSDTNNIHDGYNESLENLHITNANRLRKIIKEIGWPTVGKVGSAGAHAAWIILQHAISCPSLQRECIPLLMDLANKNEVLASEVAVLYDRMCYFEMRPQKYGTQFDFDENGILNPWEIEDMDKVDDYRKQVGLPKLAEAIKRMQIIAEKMNDKPQKPYNERLKERRKWAKKVGWI